MSKPPLKNLRMNQIPRPIFNRQLTKISWKKIFAREYGVQYSEMAILCLSPKAKYHLPQPSVNQIIIPEENNTAFFVDENSWVGVVESLNKKYTLSIDRLKKYEENFLRDGNDYLKITKKIPKLNLGKLGDKELGELYLKYQDKLFRYSVFIWTAFILNNFVTEKAATLLKPYLNLKSDKEKQKIFDILFQPSEKAAVFKLQEEVGAHKGKFKPEEFEKLCQKYKWLSCLDIHNEPLTKEKFKEFIKDFQKRENKKQIPFKQIIKNLRIKKEDFDYLLITKRLIYIKDARDDFRRQGIYHIRPLFAEIAKRVNIKTNDVSYLQESEIVDFLKKKIKISSKIIQARKKGFVLYFDTKRKLVCLQSNDIPKALKQFKLLKEEGEIKEITGTVASRGMVKGKVVVVKVVKDLEKVKKGDILVAVSTHPDYTLTMHKAAAIITNEGGLTCHAAIVSRELGIPCIVGTKVATKILNDGEMVQVDAIKGIVKRLN